MSIPSHLPPTWHARALLVCSSRRACPTSFRRSARPRLAALMVSACMCNPNGHPWPRSRAASEADPIPIAVAKHEAMWAAHTSLATCCPFNPACARSEGVPRLLWPVAAPMQASAVTERYFFCYVASLGRTHFLKEDRGKFRRCSACHNQRQHADICAWTRTAIGVKVHVSVHARNRRS